MPFWANIYPFGPFLYHDGGVHEESCFPHDIDIWRIHDGVRGYGV